MALMFFVCQAVSAETLPQGNFALRNHQLLQKLLLEHGKESPQYNPQKRPYVVCDWDNTSVFGDTEETLTYYMLTNLRYPFTVSEFRRNISLNIPQGPSKLRNDKGIPVVFVDLLNDMVDDYRHIYNNYIGFSGKKTLAEIRQTEEFKDLAAKLFVMFDALEATSGTALADRWQGQLITGMTSEQVMGLSKSSIQENLGAELRKIKLSGSRTLSRRSNDVSSTTFQGLRVYPDMANLYQTLMDNGIDVYIVSASPEDIIIPIVCSKEYGYGIPREHVFGAKFVKNNGMLQPELSPDRSMTWGAGKVDLIRREIIAQKGYDPVLVCGDSDGDYNMLSDFPGTKLGLIVNRLKKGLTGALSSQAHRELDHPAPRYIVQGINENTGAFNASEYTVKFGTNKKQLLQQGE